jgi:hypothetical protein
MIYLTLPVLAFGMTCNDVKGLYTSSQCCDADGATLLPECEQPVFDSIRLTASPSAAFNIEPKPTGTFAVDTFSIPHHELRLPSVRKFAEHYGTHERFAQAHASDPAGAMQNITHMDEMFLQIWMPSSRTDADTLYNAYDVSDDVVRDLAHNVYDLIPNSMIYSNAFGVYATEGLDPTTFIAPPAEGCGWADDATACLNGIDLTTPAAQKLIHSKGYARILPFQSVNVSASISTAVAKFPVVWVQSGLGAYPALTRSLSVELASQGYIVVSPAIKYYAVNYRSSHMGTTPKNPEWAKWLNVYGDDTATETWDGVEFKYADFNSAIRFYASPETKRIEISHLHGGAAILETAMEMLKTYDGGALFSKMDISKTSLWGQSSGGGVGSALNHATRRDGKAFVYTIDGREVETFNLRALAISEPTFGAYQYIMDGESPIDPDTSYRQLSYPYPYPDGWNHDFVGSNLWSVFNQPTYVRYGKDYYGWESYRNGITIPDAIQMGFQNANPFHVQNSFWETNTIDTHLGSSSAYNFGGGLISGMSTPINGWQYEESVLPEAPLVQRQYATYHKMSCTVDLQIIRMTSLFFQARTAPPSGNVVSNFMLLRYNKWTAGNLEHAPYGSGQGRYFKKIFIGDVVVRSAGMDNATHRSGVEIKTNDKGLSIDDVHVVGSSLKIGNAVLTEDKLTALLNLLN